METKSIQEFLALAELGSSYAAAEKLFVSQSSLVRHIQTLEEEFGVQLFDRTRRGFVLNANGQIFLPYAEKIAKLQNSCYKALHHEQEDVNTIRITADVKVIDLIIDFKKVYPQYNIEFLRFSNAEEQLLSGGIDVAFLSDVIPNPEEITTIPFGREQALAMVYDAHPLAQRENVTLEELRDEKFVTLCEDIVWDDDFDQMFRRIGYSQKISATVPVAADLIQMVKEGMGITLIHGNAENASEMDGIKIIPVDPKIEYDVSMCYRSSVRLTSAAEAFVNFARKWRITHKNIDSTMLNQYK